MVEQVAEVAPPWGPFSALLQWYDREARDLPWRQTRDPYAILVSEIMLQQTRVETVIPFYRRFLEQFPDPKSLAQASLEEVYQRWAGLGYYRRARSLQEACRVIVQRGFPTTEAELRTLPGVGHYTAAAVASIALGQPAVALDGNALRVLTRYFACQEPAEKAATQRLLKLWVEPEIPPERAGDFTQAVIELGARICSPRLPRCLACPLQERCQARLQQRTESIPRLPPRRSRVKVLGRALCIRSPEGVLLERGASHPFLRDQWLVPLLLVDKEPQATWEAYRQGYPGSEPTQLGRIEHGITFRDLELEVWTWDTVTAIQADSQRCAYSGDGSDVPALTRKALSLLGLLQLVDL